MSDAPQLREVWRISSVTDRGYTEYDRDSIEAVIRAVRAELTDRARLIKIERSAAA